MPFKHGSLAFGGVAAGGGHTNTVIYVWTNQGQLYRGQVQGGPASDELTTGWVNVSKGGPNGVSLIDVRSVYVDPYDANDVYVTDLGDDAIKASTDGGKDWTYQPTLEDIASDYGQYKLGGVSGAMGRYLVCSSRAGARLST